MGNTEVAGVVAKTNKGQVVGQSWFFDGQQVTASHAFLWEDDGPMVDLNTLIANPTDLYLTEANFITDRGWIIANGLLPNGDIRTGILIPEGEAESLNLASTPANGESTLKPLPPRPDKLSSFKKPGLPRDYHSQSLAKYSMQLHGYPQRHK
jgi:probable HAF family extracellular repeat protein